MLKEPSALRSQPSKTGTTFCPLAYRTWARATTEYTEHTERNHTKIFCAFRAFCGCFLSSAFLTCPLGELRFVLFVAHRIERQPVARHVVGRAIAEADPVPRIRVVFVGRRIVVPRDDVHDRARRQQRRHV